MKRILLIILIGLNTTACAALSADYSRVDWTPMQQQAAQWTKPTQYQSTPSKQLDGACFNQCLAMGSNIPFCKAQCSY